MTWRRNVAYQDGRHLTNQEITPRLIVYPATAARIYPCNTPSSLSSPRCTSSGQSGQALCSTKLRQLQPGAMETRFGPPQLLDVPHQFYTLRSIPKQRQTDHYDQSSTMHSCTRQRRHRASCLVLRDARGSERRSACWTNEEH